MKQPTLMQINCVPVVDIIERDRLRPIMESGVESLLASIAETGVMKDAIHVRKKKDGKFYLIAGGHRLEAARRLGWAEIEAKVWTDVTDDWAKIMEIDDNLAGAEMNALDTAVFLATRKAVYERLHPETKRGIAGAAARWDATEPSSVAFVNATAEKFGLTDRQIRKIVAAGVRLGADEVERLRKAPRQVSLKDLIDIGKIEQPVERYDVVRMLSEGAAKSVSDARRSIGGGNAAKQQEAPSDAGFKALNEAWARAQTSARRRFADDNRVELLRLLSLPLEDEASA